MLGKLGAFSVHSVATYINNLDHSTMDSTSIHIGITAKYQFPAVEEIVLSNFL